MKVLSRGKIREAPSPLTWVNGLLSLQAQGGWDTADVMQAWNAQASKSDRLTGGRFMTVKNVLEMDPDVRGVLIDAINTAGWNRLSHASKPMQHADSYKLIVLFCLDAASCLSQVPHILKMPCPRRSCFLASFSVVPGSRSSRTGGNSVQLPMKARPMH